MESPCECDIEPPGSISHGVSYYFLKEIGMIRLRIGIIWRTLVNAAFYLRVPYAMELNCTTYRHIRMTFIIIYCTTSLKIYASIRGIGLIRLRIGIIGEPL